MYELEIDKIGEIIDAAPLSMNLMFVGDTGIGKTSVVERYCEEKGFFLKTLILSQLDASETLGIPIKSQKEFHGNTYDCLSTALPQWIFELSEHKNSVLFLDEFLCAQPSVMNAFLNFLSQKRVGGIDLTHVRILAATNIGNYTFDPDNNILSRFCWFYTINTRVNEFLNDKRIINNYKDKNDREGVLFEVRQLKPRCHEQLIPVADNYFQMFHEGFTNRKYIVVHKNEEVNDVISPYFVAEAMNKFSISSEQLVTMTSVLLKTFNRFRKWDKIISEFVNIDLGTIDTIRKIIEAKTNEK